MIKQEMCDDVVKYCNSTPTPIIGPELCEPRRNSTSSAGAQARN